MWNFFLAALAWRCLRLWLPVIAWTRPDSLRRWRDALFRPPGAEIFWWCIHWLTAGQLKFQINAFIHSHASGSQSYTDNEFMNTDVWREGHEEHTAVMMTGRIIIRFINMFHAAVVKNSSAPDLLQWNFPVDPDEPHCSVFWEMVKYCSQSLDS